MWFRYLQLYRFNEAYTTSETALAEALESKAFAPCLSQQPSSYGWVPPLGKAGTELIHIANGKIMICARKEEKILPAAAVRDQLDERIETLEARDGRKIRGKEKTQLKEDIVQEMMPRAFSRSSKTYAYIDPQNSCLVVEASSAKKAEELISLLRECLGSLPVKPLTVNTAPHVVFTEWLKQGEAEGGFTLLDSCEMHAMSEEGGVVKIQRQDLTSEEIQVHIDAGKCVTRLGLNFEDRMSFTLNDSLEFKGVKFLDLVTDTLDDFEFETAAEEFDACFALMSLELGNMLPHLVHAMGGEPEE